jgi:hypothetical protein
MNIRQQLGTLLAILMGGIGLVALVGAAAVVTIRSEIVQLSEKTSPLQVNLAKLQRAFEHVSGNFARISAVSSASELRHVERDTDSTLSEMEQIGTELERASQHLDRSIVEQMKQTHGQLRALAGDRLEARRRVGDVNQQVARAIEAVTAVTRALTAGMAELQNGSQDALLQSKKASQDSNANIKAMLVLREKAGQMHSLAQDVRLVDKKFRLNVLRDKAKAVLDAMAGQSIPDKDLAAQIKGFVDKFGSAFEGDAGLLASRAAVLASPQDDKARQDFDDKSKAFNSSVDALVARVLEVIDPLELSSQKANAGMNQATGLMTQVNRISAATAELNTGARTIQALAWQLMAAGDTAAADGTRQEIESQYERVEKRLREIQTGLSALHRKSDLSAVAAAGGAFSQVREKLVGRSGVAIVVRQGIEQRIRAENLFASALQSIQQVALAGSNRARDAETAQKVAVERIRSLSNATILLFGLVGLTALGVGGVTGRRIRRSILAAEAQQSQVTEDMRRIVQAVRSNTRALRGASQELTSTSEAVMKNVESVAVSADLMSGNITQIGASATRASAVGSEAGELVQSASRTVTRLNEASIQISSVTEMIRQIAFQTNLLALNAAVEAARAGEAGLGFQVVAGEVKKLAKAAAEATQAIDTRITANQQETQRVQEVFSKITLFIAQIHSMQDSIAGAVSKQTETTRDIGARIQETAARFRGSQTHGGIHVMAQKLSRMAGNLEKLCNTGVEGSDESVNAPQPLRARC